MKCLNCKKGTLEKKKDKYVLEIPKGPSLVIPNISMRVCSECEDKIVDGATSRLIDNIALSSLVLHYLPVEKKMSASVGDWIRKTVGMSVKEVMENTGQDETTYYQATRRGSSLDSMAKYFLILKATHFVVGIDFSKAIQEMFAQVGNAVSKDGSRVDFIEAAV